MLRKKTNTLHRYAIGLDASLTSFGVYFKCITGGEDYHYALQSTARDGSDLSRVSELANSIMESVFDLDNQIAIAVFEDYGPVNKTAGKITARAEICGILKHFFLRGLALPVVTVPPTSLKDYATGNAKAAKAQMIRACHSYGFFPATSDEADAFHLSRMGIAISNGTRVNTSYQLHRP